MSGRRQTQAVVLIEIEYFKGCQSTSPPDTSPFSPPGVLGAGETHSFQPLRYAWDWRYSILSAPQVSWGLAGLSPFRPPGSLATGGTQSFQDPQVA